MSTYTTTVTVHKNGQRVGSGYKVSLEFTGLMGGFTNNFYTNSNGTAHVSHASQGSVNVYVGGDWSSHRTRGTAPGSINVYL